MWFKTGIGCCSIKREVEGGGEEKPCFNQPPEGGDDAFYQVLPVALFLTGTEQHLTSIQQPPRREPVAAQVPAAGLMGLLNHQCHESSVVSDIWSGLLTGPL